ncbi:preprotein translocase subunit SecA [Streptomyces sp. W007]|nr:preprotein translocase subunit SecA [Streptomyces sp. W007]
MHRALAAEDREQALGEPLVRALRPVGLQPAGPLWRYRPGTTLVASAGGPRPVRAHDRRPR